VLLSSAGREVVGFFVFYYQYSTFKGKAGMYIEDLYIREQYRGAGYGSRMLLHIMRMAAEQGMARLEWQVVSWNSAAQEFYKKMGAEVDPKWKVVRVEEGRLQELVKGGRKELLRQQ
jgi:GNAT superfamily N-acetyltransferase